MALGTGFGVLLGGAAALTAALVTATVAAIIVLATAATVAAILSAVGILSPLASDLGHMFTVLAHRLAAFASEFPAADILIVRARFAALTSDLGHMLGTVLLHDGLTALPSGFLNGHSAITLIAALVATTVAALVAVIICHFSIPSERFRSLFSDRCIDSDESADDLANSRNYTVVS